MAQGVGFSIDANFLNKIKEADKALKKLADSNDKVAKKISNTWKQIGEQGLDSYLRSLEKQKRVLSDIASIKFDNSAPSYLKKFGENAKSSVAEIDKLIQTLTTLQQATPKQQAIEKARQEAYDIVARADAKTGGKDWSLTGEVALREYQAQLEAMRRYVAERKAMYAQMFDEIDAKERKQQADYSNYRQQQLNDELTQYRKNKEAQAAIDKRNHDRKQRELEEIFRLQAQHEERLRKRQQSLYNATGDSSQGALNYANRLFSGSKPMTLNNMQTALAKLQDAQRKLNLDTDAGKKKYEQLAAMIRRVQQRINEATGASEKLKNSHTSLINTSDQLMRKLALVFSVSQIQGYINKLAQVRGEFELQQRALQAILQNKDAADKLWQQTVDLAVRSPFRVGELVKYTKQLAAYRIETDKLHDTTKRLADVSAGLGVDMSRLILAYGQVRAASYLRGTELRQFTEAGIPMLEELAKYFTELDGKAVSVGDVFGRISKRMVAFSDVEEVFKRMTDAGGTFYNMQEIQAETLKGQISNLHDSIDIMLNDIGKANDGVLKGGVQVAKSFVENWEKISIVLKQVVTSITVISFAKFIAGFKASGLALNLFLKQANGAALAGAKLKSTFLKMGSWLKTHPWIALAGVIASVSWALYDLYQQSQKTRRELEKLEIQGAFDAQMSVTEFKRLADSVRDTSKSYKEQKQALDTLQRKYKDIVPDHLLEVKNIKDTKKGYDEATNAIRAYIAEKTKEKQIQLIESEEGKKVSDAMGVLSKSLRKKLSETLGGADVTAQQVQPIIDKFKEGIEIGEIDFSNYISKLREIIKLHTSLDIAVSNLTYGSAGGYSYVKTFNVLGDEARVFYSALKSMNKAIDEISGKSIDFGSFMPIKEVEDISNKYNERLNVFKDLLDVIRKYQDEIKLINKGELKIENRLISKEQYDETLAQLNKLFKDVGLEAPKWNKIINDTFRLNKETIAYNTALWQQQIKDINELDIAENLFGARENYVEKIEKQINDFNGDKFTKEINRIVIELADKFKVTTEGLEALFYDSSKGLDEYVNNVRTIIKDLFQTMAKHEASVKNKILLSPISNEQYKILKEQKPLLEALLKIFESFGKQPKSGKGKDWWLEMIKGIQDLHKEFNTLNKDLDDADAKALALEKYTGVFDEIKKNLGDAAANIDISKLDFTDENAIKRFLQDIKESKELSKEAKLAIEKAISGIEGEATIRLNIEQTDELSRAINDLFGNYELSLEIEKLNIPKDLAKDLLGINPVYISSLRDSILDEANLSDLKNQTNEQIYDSESFKALSAERQKAVKAALEKEEELERKAQEERIKKYILYGRETTKKRVEIKTAELNHIAEIKKAFAIKEGDSDETKASKEKERIRAIAVARQQALEKLKKIEWEEFKSSDTFNMIFDDLENAGDAALGLVIKKLEKFKEQWTDMPFDQMRQVVDLLQKAEEAQKVEDKSRKERKRLRKAISDDGRSKETVISDLSNAEEEIQKQNELLAQYEQFRQLKEGLLKVDTLTTEEQQKYTEWLNKGEKGQEDLIKAAEKTKNEAEDTAKAAKDHLNNIKKLDNEYKKQAEQTGKIKQMANDVYGSFKDLAEVLVDTEDGVGGIAALFADAGMSMANSVLDAIMLQAELKAVEVQAGTTAAKINTAMGVIGWIVMAIQLLTTALKAAFDAHDKGLQREIDSLADSVERLEKDFERIEKQIERTFTGDEAMHQYERATANIERRIAANQKMRALEEEKKKKDKSAIKGYADAIDDLEEELVELQEQKLIDFGGLGGDYKSAAEDFIDAWYDAFQETGDGIKGLEESFDELLQNVVKKQMLMRGMEGLLRPVLQMIDTAVNDSYVTEKEWEDILKSWEDSKNPINEYLKGIYELFGMTSSGELSELQKGIQSITEPQAAAIEAYLNSMRFFVSDSNSILKNIHNSINISTSTPIMSELKAQTQLIRTIDENLSSVIGNNSTAHQGAYIRVLAK